MDGKLRGVKRREQEGKERTGRREGKGTPPLTQIPGSAPAVLRLYNTPSVNSGVRPCCDINTASSLVSVDMIRHVRIIWLIVMCFS